MLVNCQARKRPEGTSNTYFKVKEANLKKKNYVQYDSNVMTFWRKIILRRQEKDQYGQGVGEEEKNRREERILGQ